ncbi:MAG: Hsp33 family molecular chaperone HslO [Gammaproteobacteria bacterium]|nr:Hsp33 family molecular chaperone HslO [Gammaproteobacteria bacterium]
MSTDLLHRFSFAGAPIRGQWVRLDEVLGEVCGRQPYPAVVRQLLGEMLAAVAMFADGIKFKGAVSLHCQGDGPLTMLMAECRSQHLLRAIGRWDPQRAPVDPAAMNELLGNGQLAISLLSDPADGTGVSYQGLISLEQGDLAGNLEVYFATSEQLPSRLLFASDSTSVTGLLLQRMPAPVDATEVEFDQHEALWEEVEVLVSTVTSAELCDLPADALLNRLFETYTLNLHPPRNLRFECTCNREKTVAAILTLAASEVVELLDSQGEITVTCEVCGHLYRYDRVDAHLLLEPGNPRIH